jgi:hypothetical protein
MAAHFRKALASVAVSLLATGALAPAASASPGGVIRDCSEDGVLNGHYSHGDLTKALDQLPSDLDEYTDCRAVIRSAQLGSAAPKHRGGRGPGIAGKVDAASPPRLNEQRKIAQAAGAGGQVKIGGKGIRPGAGGASFKTAGFGTDLPGLVLVVLIALGAMVLGAGALAVQRHRPALARAGGSRLAQPFTRAVRGVRNGISRFRR